MSRDSGDSQFPGPLPVGIYSRGKAPPREDRPRIIHRQADSPGYPHQFVHQRDVPSLDEKRPVYRQPVRVSPSLLLRPFTQFLSPPAVGGAGSRRHDFGCAWRYCDRDL